MTTVGQMDVLITIRRWGYIEGLDGGLIEVNTASWELWAKVEAAKGGAITDNSQMTWSCPYVITCYFERDRPIFNNDTVDYDGLRLTLTDINIESEGNRQFLKIEGAATGNALTTNLSTMIQIYNGTGAQAEPAPNNNQVFIEELHGKVLKLVCKDGVEFKFITEGVLNEGEKEVLFEDVYNPPRLTFGIPFFSDTENFFIQYADL